MAKVLIHAGYPKAMSTSFQRSFYQCKEINYLGVGIGDNISYQNKAIEFIFEILLKYSRIDFFDENKSDYRLSLNQVLSSDKLNVISSEHLVLNFSLQGIDPVEKVRRLSYLLEGHQTRILLISRNIDDFMTSIYGEFVKMGYSESYNFFHDWIYALEDRSFIKDLDFEKKKSLFLNFFKDVELISFEELTKLSLIDLNKKIAEILDVKSFNFESNNLNSGLNANDINTLINFNKKTQREMSKGIMEPFERHRNRSILENYFSEDIIFENVKSKREGLKALKQDYPSK